MTYFTDLHTYLHQSSLLIQAYPTTRITTKYSLPRKPNPKARSSSKSKQTDVADADASTTTPATQSQSQAKREPSAVLVLKTFHPESGICLKYRTDKAAEVGRLLAGLGRLAKAEVIEIPTSGSTTTSGQNVVPSTTNGAAGADKMDIDSGVALPKTGDGTVAAPPAATQTGGGGGGGGKGKKKKGKK